MSTALNVKTVKCPFSIKGVKYLNWTQILASVYIHTHCSYNLSHRLEGLVRISYINYVTNFLTFYNIKILKNYVKAMKIS